MSYKELEIGEFETFWKKYGYYSCTSCRENAEVTWNIKQGEIEEKDRKIKELHRKNSSLKHRLELTTKIIREKLPPSTYDEKEFLEECDELCDRKYKDGRIN